MAHLSDLHFGHHDEVVSATLAPELNAQDLDIVVISGDFTQDGEEDEFQIARAFIDALNAPVFAVPGNHDVPQRNLLKRVANPYGLYKQYIDPSLEPFLDTKGVALLGLKTPRRITPDMNWSNGFLGRSQLNAIGPRFAEAAPDSMRVIVAHHPLLYPEGQENLRQRRVRRADQALQTFARHGVRLVLSGHFHLSYVRVHEAPGSVMSGVPAGLRRSAAAPILVAQTSSTISTRLRGHPNAYNLIEIEGGTIEIAVREWLGSGWVTRERKQEAATSPDGEPAKVA